MIIISAEITMATATESIYNQAAEKKIGDRITHT